jgi:hypothetical protein
VNRIDMTRTPAWWTPPPKLTPADEELVADWGLAAVRASSYGDAMAQATYYQYPDSGWWTPRPPTPEPTCECGSGSNVRSGGHSHWCRLWMAP